MKLTVKRLIVAVVICVIALGMATTDTAYAASKTKKPSKVKVTSVKYDESKNAITIKWKKAKNAKKYVVYYRYGKSGKYKKVATTKKNTYTIKNVKGTSGSGTVCYIKVRGVNGSKYGKYSAVKKVIAKTAESSSSSTETETTNNVSGDDCLCHVTQYSDVTGAQSQFYTITKDNKLIIIDGGWAENADEVRKVIFEHGNHVDAWFISHTHSDHVGAFNEIYSDPRGITIDVIFDNGYDYDFLMEAGEPWDGNGLTPLTTYYELTKDVVNVVHLKRGMELAICGLTVQVYNAFDDTVIDIVGNDSSEVKEYQNNASLCLKFINENESFLYMGDIKSEMNTYLSETYGEKLYSDYVQLSHHGNWGMSNEYYLELGAKAYFIDIPDTFFTSHPVGELRQYLLDNGKICYDYSTAPNEITLR